MREPTSPALFSMPATPTIKSELNSDSSGVITTSPDPMLSSATTADLAQAIARLTTSNVTVCAPAPVTTPTTTPLPYVTTGTSPLLAVVPSISEILTTEIESKIIENSNNSPSLSINENEIQQSEKIVILNYSDISISSEQTNCSISSDLKLTSVKDEFENPPSAASTVVFELNSVPENPQSEGSTVVFDIPMAMSVESKFSSDELTPTQLTEGNDSLVIDNRIAGETIEPVRCSNDGSSRPLESQVLPQSAQRLATDFKCDVCNYVVYSTAQLESHARELHPEYFSFMIRSMIPSENNRTATSNTVDQSSVIPFKSISQRNVSSLHSSDNPSNLINIVTSPSHRMKLSNPSQSKESTVYPLPKSSFKEDFRTTDSGKQNVHNSEQNLHSKNVIHNEDGNDIRISNFRNDPQNIICVEPISEMSQNAACLPHTNKEIVPVDEADRSKLLQGPTVQMVNNPRLPPLDVWENPQANPSDIPAVTSQTNNRELMYPYSTYASDVPQQCPEILNASSTNPLYGHHVTGYGQSTSNNISSVSFANPYSSQTPVFPCTTNMPQNYCISSSLHRPSVPLGHATTQPFTNINVFPPNYASATRSVNTPYLANINPLTHYNTGNLSWTPPQQSPSECQPMQESLFKKRATSLNPRLKIVPENEKKFTCPYCYNVVYGRQSLFDHVSLHANNDPSTYRKSWCPYCTNKYMNKQEMIHHFKSHTAEEIG